MTDGTGLSLEGEAFWGKLTQRERDTIRLLARLEQHTFLTKLGDAIADVTQTVSEMNSPGAVTAKLVIAQPNQGEPLISLVATITKKMPAHRPLGQFTYYQDGVFGEEDARQTKLPLGRIVDVGDDEIRTVVSMRSERRVGE